MGPPLVYVDLDCTAVCHDLSFDRVNETRKIGEGC
jgi:hypothetical protein